MLRPEPITRIIANSVCEERPVPGATNTQRSLPAIPRSAEGGGWGKGGSVAHRRLVIASRRSRARGGTSAHGNRSRMLQTSAALGAINAKTAEPGKKAADRRHRDI
jgi:hypothetical protein